MAPWPAFVCLAVHSLRSRHYDGCKMEVIAAAFYLSTMSWSPVIGRHFSSGTIVVNLRLVYFRFIQVPFVFNHGSFSASLLYIRYVYIPANFSVLSDCFSSVKMVPVQYTGSTTVPCYEVDSPDVAQRLLCCGRNAIYKEIGTGLETVVNLGPGVFFPRCSDNITQSVLSTTETSVYSFLEPSSGEQAIVGAGEFWVYILVGGTYVAIFLAVMWGARRKLLNAGNRVSTIYREMRLLQRPQHPQEFEVRFFM